MDLSRTYCGWIYTDSPGFRHRLFPPIECFFFNFIKNMWKFNPNVHNCTYYYWWTWYGPVIANCSQIINYFCFKPNHKHIFFKIIIKRNWILATPACNVYFCFKFFLKWLKRDFFMSRNNSFWVSLYSN